MTEETEMKWEPIEAALAAGGISIPEAAEIIDYVTRQTLYNWKKGDKIGDTLRYRGAILICKLIHRAVDLKLLPLSTDVKSSERVTMIKKALAAAKSKV